MLGSDLWMHVKAWPWKEIAPWAGIAISLSWNFFNTFLSNRVWRKNQNFQEFRSLKPPVDVAVGKLRETKAKLHSADTFGGAAASFDENFKEINKELVSNKLSLTVALEACDRSDHWPEEDLSQKSEGQWDEIFSVFNGLFEQDELEGKRAQAAIAAQKLGQLIDDISREIEQTVSVKISGKHRKRRFWRKRLRAPAPRQVGRVDP